MKAAALPGLLTA